MPRQVLSKNRMYQLVIQFWNERGFKRKIDKAFLYLKYQNGNKVRFEYFDSNEVYEYNLLTNELNGIMDYDWIESNL